MSFDDHEIDNSEILTLAASTLHQLGQDEDEGLSSVDDAVNRRLGSDFQREEVSRSYGNVADLFTGDDLNSNLSSLSLQERVDVEDEYLSKLTIDTLRSFRQDEMLMSASLDDSDEMDLEEQRLLSAEALVREELSGLDMKVSNDSENTGNNNFVWEGQELADSAVRIGLKRLVTDCHEYTCPIAPIPGCQYNDDKSLWLSGYREFLRRMKSKELQRMFSEVIPYQNDGSPSSPSTLEQDKLEEPASLRTVSIRIRPDVLCGAVMDAITTVVQLECHGEIIKRQGGHLIAEIPSHRRHVSKKRRRESNSTLASPFTGFYHRELNQREEDVGGETIILPAVTLDAQICTKKLGGNFERIVLLRFYNSCSQVIGIVVDDVLVENSSYSWASVDQIWDAANMIKAINDEWRSPQVSSSHNLSTPMNIASKVGRLMGSPISYISTKIPNERNENDLEVEKISHSANFPSVLIETSKYVDACWKPIAKCILELDNRDLVYASLGKCDFATFPALTTLDVHYCYQLRLICRESMILSLLDSAAGLERFARESEKSCALMIYLLSWVFKAYNMKAPIFPKSIPLSAYPLEFSPPEAISPPWGKLVGDVLNEISIGTYNAVTESNIDACTMSISKVISALQSQSDLEKDARLQRKNLQVIDRLAKVQAHKRKSVIMLRDSYSSNQSAREAADALFTKVSHVLSSTDAGIQPSYLVPLLVCGILSFGSSGTVYVTAHHLILITQFIPVIGGSKIFCFKLDSIKLNPYESTIGLPTGLTLEKSNGSFDNSGFSNITFIPSIGAERFRAFVDIVNTVGVEDPGTLKLTTRGGILYMQDDEARVENGSEMFQGMEDEKNDNSTEYVTFNRTVRSESNDSN